MKWLPYIIAGLVAILFSASSAYALSTYQTVQGGTGTTSPSGILYGDNGATSHLNTVSIGSGLSFSGGTLSATGSSGGSGTVGTSSPETAGYFPTWTTNSATPALLAGTSQLFQSGNSVGIGTTTPWAQFSVNPNGVTGPEFVIGSSSATHFVVTNSGVTGIGTTTPWADLSIGGANGVNNPQFVIASSTDSSTQFLVTNNGRVGVATTSPYGYLSIDGSGIGTNIPELVLREASGQSAAPFIISNSAGTTQTSITSTGQYTTNGVRAIAAISSGTQNAGFLAAINGSSNYFLGQIGNGATGKALTFITTNGNLLQTQVDGATGYWSIGTSTNPTAVFSIEAPPTSSAVSGYGSQTDLFVVSSTTSSTYATSTLFKIQANGNVGIGTTSPWGELSLDSEPGAPQFVIGSSTGTQFIVDANGNVGVGTTTPSGIFAVINFWITALGEIIGKDIANGWFGRISPTRSFVLSSATTTTWTASTTGSGYSPSIVVPFTGTLRDVRCALDQSFLGVNVTVNGSNATPSYFVASSTVGVVAFTAGNSVSAGQKIQANFGTTTTASTLQATCTFEITETP